MIQFHFPKKIADMTVRVDHLKPKPHKAKHGLYRALVNNMVEGVSKGFTKRIGTCWSWISCI